MESSLGKWASFYGRMRSLCRLGGLSMVALSRSVGRGSHSRICFGLGSGVWLGKGSWCSLPWEGVSFAALGHLEVMALLGYIPVCQGERDPGLGREMSLNLISSTRTLVTVDASVPLCTSVSLCILRGNSLRTSSQAVMRRNQCVCAWCRERVGSFESLAESRYVVCL